MTLKTCTCGLKNTTKNAKILGVTKDVKRKILWFNCPSCNTTLVLTKKKAA